MEPYKIMCAQAEEKLKTADHLIGTTYPLVREPKLLISAIEHIYIAIDLTMTALLEHERQFVKMPSHGESFDNRLELFRRKIATKYDLNDDILEFIADTKALLDKHKKSSVEFTRKEKLVMGDDAFNIQTLSLDDVKKRFSKAKSIIKELTLIMRK